MKGKDDGVYLHHMLDCIERIEQCVARGKDTFMSDFTIHDTVIRNLEVIGEAAKSVSGETQAAHPEVPWSDAAKTRDKVIHRYFDVDLDVVWDIVENDLPDMKRQIEAILAELERT